MLAIQRFISNVWLAATPLAILLLLVSAMILLWLAVSVIGLVAGPDAAEKFLIDTMTLMGMALLLMPLCIALYAVISLVRWLRDRRRAD